MVAAAEAGLAVEEYGPNEVKSAVTGAGNADKAAGARRARARARACATCRRKPDAADAVAVALTHLAGGRLRAAQRVAAAR